MSVAAVLRPPLSRTGYLQRSASEKVMNKRVKSTYNLLRQRGPAGVNASLGKTFYYLACAAIDPKTRHLTRVMKGKLTRAAWYDPFLDLEIENKGTNTPYNTVDIWVADFSVPTVGRIAEVFHYPAPAGKRAPALDTAGLTRWVVHMVKHGRDYPYLKWHRKKQMVRVMVDTLIPKQQAPKISLSSRRKRFRTECEMQMCAAGYHFVEGRYHFYKY